MDHGSFHVPCHDHFLQIPQFLTHSERYSNANRQTGSFGRARFGRVNCPPKIVTVSKILISSGNTVEFKRWVLGFGCHATVLAPKELAEEMPHELKQAHGNYGEG